jgi:biotin carboxyl carrier protein
MIYFAYIDNKQYRIEISQNGSGLAVSVDNKPVDLRDQKVEQNHMVSFFLNGKYHQIEITSTEDGLLCWSGSQSVTCQLIDEKTARYAQIANSQTGTIKAHNLLAPMPGLIIKVEKEIGQSVAKGDGLIIMEAMKMENELKAMHAGIIKQIHVQAGQTVDKNQILITFE